MAVGHWPLAVGLSALAFACGREPRRKPPPLDEVTRADAAGADAAGRARAIYTQRCAPCHGADGKGHGVAAAGLRPPPRDFGDRAWQGGAKDDDLRAIVVKGGGAVGKSPAMPASPDLATEPAVVDELVKIVRAFGAG